MEKNQLCHCTGGVSLPLEEYANFRSVGGGYWPFAKGCVQSQKQMPLTDGQFVSKQKFLYSVCLTCSSWNMMSFRTSAGRSCRLFFARGSIGAWGLKEGECDLGGLGQ